MPGFLLADSSPIDKIVNTLTIFTLPVVNGDGVNLPCNLFASNIDVDNNTYYMTVVAHDLTGSVSNSTHTIVLTLVGDVISCEVIPPEMVLGYANQVVIPEAVFNLTSLASSADIISSFGGIAKINTIVNKIRRGDAIVSGGSKWGSAALSVGILNHVDENNLKFSITNTLGADSVRIIITVSNSIFSAATEETSCLTQTQLESNPSVGGKGIPASAEAVKVVNDKIPWNPDYNSTEEQMCIGEFFTDFDGTKRQVYYRSERRKFVLDGAFEDRSPKRTLYLFQTDDPEGLRAISVTGLIQFTTTFDTADSIMIGHSSFDGMIEGRWQSSYSSSMYLSIVVSRRYYTDLLSPTQEHNVIFNIKYTK